MRILVNIFCIVYFLLVFQNTGFGQDAFKLDKTDFDLTINSETKKVIATALNPDTFPEGSRINWSGQNGFIEITQILSSDRKMIESTFKGLKPTDSLSVTAEFGGLKIPLKISVLPEISETTLQLSPTLSNKEKKDGIEIINGGKKEFDLTLNDSLSIPENALKPKNGNTNIALASIVDNRLTIKAVGEGTTIIEILAYDKSVQNIKVVVTPALNIDSLPKTISLQKGGAAIELKDQLNLDLQKLTISQTDDQTIASITNGKLKPNAVGETSFNVSVKDNPSKTKSIKVIVKANPVKINLKGLEGFENLILDTPVRVTAVVEDDEGKENQNIPVSLKPNKPECVIVETEPNNVFKIKAIKDFQCDPVILTAKIEGTNITQDFIIGVKRIGGFSPLEIRLDLLDKNVAKDLFGGKTADEFFIAKIRLFNKVRDNPDNPNSFYRNPILVYSESLEVKVAVQIKCADDAMENCAEKVWTDLSQEKFNSIFPDGFPDNNSDFCKVYPQTGFFFPYRPLTFEMVTNTQDSRADRSTRSKIMRTINGVSSAASFVTSIAVPGAGSDLPLGLDKFKNLLVPSFERLYPSMREVHRQNVIRFAMRPLEEIPFGSDITKVVFFPKSPIKGMMPGYLVRITGVSVSNACAEVAIIQKISNL